MKALLSFELSTKRPRCLARLIPWRCFVNPNRILGGSWVVISGVISRVTIVISPIRGLITILITTHEPPSRVSMRSTRNFRVGVGLHRGHLGRPKP